MASNDSEDRGWRSKKENKLHFYAIELSASDLAVSGIFNLLRSSPRTSGTSGQMK